MEKSARHLSTGEKITQAADDGSAYAISERMRAMIRGLRQANDNAKTATDLLKTAEDALHGTTGLLRRMKELAVQAANGIYSDADYRAMDDEYQQCKSQLDDIAALTNYNGIPLLDGSWESRSAGNGRARQIQGRAAAPTGPAAYTQTGNTITITGDGVYTIPSNIAPNTIIEVKSKNVLIRQASAQAVQNLSIQCDPGTNLFIKDLNVKVDDTIGNNSIIDFQGTGNTLTLMGTNNLKGEFYNGVTPSLIHVGINTELTIQENGKSTIHMEKSFIYRQNDDGGAVLGGDPHESCGKIIIDSGNIFVKNGIGSNGAGIGGGCCRNTGGPAVAGTIVINGGHIEAHAEDGAAIGVGSDGDNVNIVINGGTVEAYIDQSRNTNCAAAIGSSVSSHATITINGGYVKGTTVPSVHDELTRRPVGNGYKGTATLNIAPNVSYHTEDTPNISNVDVYGDPPEPEPTLHERV